MISIDLYALPNTPGIYLFHGKNSEILYIGKAKNLQKRLSQYRTTVQGDWKLISLLKESISISWIETENERSALYLEAELITTLKPKFNQLLTGNAPFSYILFDDTSESLPIIRVIRYFEKKNDALVTIGPFLEKRTASLLKNYFDEKFLLGICNKKISHGCLAYHLKKCAGSCRDDFDPILFKKRFDSAKEILVHLSSGIIDDSFKKIEGDDSFIRGVEDIKNDVAKIIFQKSEEIQYVIKRAQHNEKIIQDGLFFLKDYFDIVDATFLIDSVDVSHFAGMATVGIVVRFHDSLSHSVIFSKKLSYAFDDYANIGELLKFAYIDKNISRPKILLIDGGKGQLGIAKKVLSNVPSLHIIALAKREERLFTEKNPEGILLSPESAMGKILISLRNATHHAAVIEKSKIHFM